MPVNRHPDFVVIPAGDFSNEEFPYPEEISPECRALLAVLDVPVEILDFDFGNEIH